MQQMQPNTKVKHTPNVRMLVLCALFTALIAVGAFIRVPMPVCPFTLQVLFVILAGMLLGPKYGAVSAALYLVAGLIGLPIFTKGGGIWYVMEPTFGFIIGFVVGALATGLLVQKCTRLTFWKLFGAGLIGLVALYPIGLVYYYFAARIFVHNPIGVWALLLNCCLMTLPGDILSCALCALLSKRLLPILRR